MTFNWRLLVSTFVFLAATALCAVAAGAHANLERAEPAADAKLAEPPPELVLYFTQRLKPEGSWVRVSNESKQAMTVSPIVDADAKTIRTSLPRLEPGVYTVEWQSLSADDDDYADGSFKLTVFNPDGSDPGGVASSSPAPATSEDGGSGMTTVVAVVVGVALVGAALYIVLRPRRATS